jgi:hypothetical protein
MFQGVLNCLTFGSPITYDESKTGRGDTALPSRSLSPTAIRPFPNPLTTHPVTAHCRS